MDILTDYPKCLGEDVAAEIVQWNIEYNTRDTSSSENAEYELTVYLKNGYRIREYSEIRDTENADEILHGLWERVEKQIRVIIGYRDYRGGALGKKGRADSTWVSLSSGTLGGTITLSDPLHIQPLIPKTHYELVETEIGDRIGICDLNHVVYCVDKKGGISTLRPEVHHLRGPYPGITGVLCSISQMKVGHTYMATTSKGTVYIKPASNDKAVVCENGHVRVVNDFVLYMCSQDWIKIWRIS